MARAGPKRARYASKRTLTGYGIATELPTPWEHTYVRAGRKAWGCFGRSAGGRALASGEGDVDVADCLAGDDETAGIRYLITGVCHQAANRILYPAGITVCRARGFNVSAFFFGVYGTGTWPELERCSRRGRS